LIKGRFARALAKHERPTAARKTRGERGIWQRRFWEHMIRDEADDARHVEYCCINPLNHRLVALVRDWPYSSFHRDVRTGLFPADWGKVRLICPTGKSRAISIVLSSPRRKNIPFRAHPKSTL
jgi:putative transposase